MGLDADPKAFDYLRHHVQKTAAVLVITEDALSFMPPGHDMVRRPRKLHPHRTSHALLCQECRVDPYQDPMVGELPSGNRSEPAAVEIIRN